MTISHVEAASRLNSLCPALSGATVDLGGGALPPAVELAVQQLPKGCSGVASIRGEYLGSIYSDDDVLKIQIDVDDVQPRDLAQLPPPQVFRAAEVAKEEGVALYNVSVLSLLDKGGGGLGCARG